MAKIVIESFNKDFDFLTPKIKKATTKLAKLLKIEDGYLEVYLVDDNVMRTNVLSFSAPADFPRPDMKGWRILGEIYLNPRYIRKQCLAGAIPDLVFKLCGRASEDKKYLTTVLYMLIHALLHLVGYDHKKNSDKIKMEKKEKQLLGTSATCG